MRTLKQKSAQGKDTLFCQYVYFLYYVYSSYIYAHHFVRYSLGGGGDYAYGCLYVRQIFLYVTNI